MNRADKITLIAASTITVISGAYFVIQTNRVKKETAKTEAKLNNLEAAAHLANDLLSNRPH